MRSPRVTSVAGTDRVAIDRGWECAAGVEPKQWIPASVPGTAAGALRAAGAWSWDDKRAFDGEDWWFRAKLPAIGHGPCVLGLDGIATLASVTIDGLEVARSSNMFAAHEVALDGPRPGAELVIRCRALDAELAMKRARPRWKVPMLEQQQLRWIRTTLLGRTPGWSPPCPAVGPWRPVWIEKRGPLVVGEVDLRSHLDGSRGVVDISVELAGCERAELVVDTTKSRLERGDGRWRGRVEIPAPRRWWPHTHGEPARYAVAIDTDRGRIELGHTGFRTIEVIHDPFAIVVNGTRVFCRGACWTPLDVVTLGGEAAAYRGAVDRMREAGLNMVRIGGTMVYEDARLYDALDAGGVLLWQDLMFANMDYPDDPAFAHDVVEEVDQQLAALQGRPSLVVVCGNSEGEQQAAMFGADRKRWAQPLFAAEGPLAGTVEKRVPGVPYVPSSATRGAFPHAANAGPSSYYGVGAYLRDLDDARRSEVCFATECLAFANIPTGTMPKVHQSAWRARAPRDLGAGWDFDDVRDHYVKTLYGVDPAAVRYADHERYLALGRAASGEVMARTFAEWRRARSRCGGGLVWFWKDLWPGAGWGILDAAGNPKPCWFSVARACAPQAIAITDEGVNGLALHVANDRGEPLAARVDVAVYRSGEFTVAKASREIVVDARGAVEIAAASLFDHFLDLSWAYRFGPPVGNVVQASLNVHGGVISDAFWFPAGFPAREHDVGLTAKALPIEGDGYELAITARRFAQSVTIDAGGYRVTDEGFHLAPGQTRHVRLSGSGALRGHVSALNAEATARIES